MAFIRRDVPVSRRGPRNLLESIPTDDEGLFSFNDAVQARLRNGMTEEGTSHMLSMWKVRGYISQITDHSFKKTTPAKASKRICA